MCSCWVKYTAKTLLIISLLVVLLLVQSPSTEASRINPDGTADQGATTARRALAGAACSPFYTESRSVCRKKLGICSTLKWVSANCDRKNSTLNFRIRGCLQREWCFYKCPVECNDDRHCEWDYKLQVCFARNGDQRRKQRARRRQTVKDRDGEEGTSSPTVSLNRKFVINVEFPEGVTESRKLAVQTAANTWANAIEDGYSTNVTAQTGMAFCRYVLKKDYVITDLMVIVLFEKIDGLNNVLARTGVCALDENGRPRLSLVRFDIDDFPLLESFGEAGVLALHEIGHALGLGSLWDFDNMISPEPTRPILYMRPQGNLGHTEIGGNGANASIEDQDGSGSARLHWKESVYGNELMTSEHDANAVMSRLTLRALEDLGYGMNVSKAGPFSISTGNTLSQGNKSRIAENGRTIKHMDDVDHDPPIVLLNRERKPLRLRSILNF